MGLPVVLVILTPDTLPDKSLSADKALFFAIVVVSPRETVLRGKRLSDCALNAPGYKTRKQVAASRASQVSLFGFIQHLIKSLLIAIC
jgi:hypothetical protein